MKGPGSPLACVWGCLLGGPTMLRMLLRDRSGAGNPRAREVRGGAIALSAVGTLLKAPPREDRYGTGREPDFGKERPPPS